MSERVVLASVLVAVTALPGACFHRQNTGVAHMADGRVVRFGRPGQPDILGCLRGRAVGIEVKDRGRQSAVQRAWQRNWEAAGGLYVLARSADDAVQALRVVP